ncbi:hypothetical protein OESDEN_19498 [Oesophagostomum dentatum]|uniref:Glutamyl/glutaminyl-tRNA synthetase class Ib anti-codon binding domain-containing protein n=1 Tax=Oesophagostomum dentatum TaxID=61180 RepID=A0A0B1SB83_OESDE|nr:hypothetical protein OESDEN_19498 [Oesophagostomum dentatum]
MAVLEGLKLTIENFDEMNLPSTVTVPDFPSDPQCSKTHEVAFDRVVYIERSDYRQVELCCSGVQIFTVEFLESEELSLDCFFVFFLAGN